MHRVGEVPVQEASVMIVVSAPHRKDSLEAVCTEGDGLLRAFLLAPMLLAALTTHSGSVRDRHAEGASAHLEEGMVR